MTLLLEFTNTFLLVLLFENTLFARALGSGRLIRLIEHPSTILPFCGILTWMTTASSLLAWALTTLNRWFTIPSFGKPLAFVAVMLVVYALTCLVWGSFFKGSYNTYRPLLSPAMFNCTVLGSIYIGTRENLSAVSALGLGFGTAVGFLLAVIIMYYGKRQLAKLDIPESFQGLPSEMIYIGIISLAIYGFIGSSILF